MTSPPALSYASPRPPPRGLTATFVLLLVLGALYAGAVALACIDIATHRSLDLFGYFLYSFAAISATIFITAAIRIRRRSYPWVRIAFATTLINIAALISCFGFALISGEARRFSDLFIGCCFFILPFAFLTFLARLLFFLMRDFKQA